MVKSGAECPFHPGERLGRYNKDNKVAGRVEILEPTLCKYIEKEGSIEHTHLKDHNGITLVPRSTDGVKEFSVKNYK